MQELLSLWSWGASPSWHVDISPTQKISGLCNLVFMEASRRCDQLTQTPALFSSPKDGELG